MKEFDNDIYNLQDKLGHDDGIGVRYQLKDDSFVQSYLAFAKAKVIEHNDGIKDVVEAHVPTSENHPGSPYNLAHFHDPTRHRLGLSDLEQTQNAIDYLEKIVQEMENPQDYITRIRAKEVQDLDSTWNGTGSKILDLWVDEPLDRILGDVEQEELVFLHKEDWMEAQVDMLSMYLGEHVDTTLATKVAGCPDVDAVYSVLRDNVEHYDSNSQETIKGMMNFLMPTSLVQEMSSDVTGVIRDLRSILSKYENLHDKFTATLTCESRWDTGADVKVSGGYEGRFRIIEHVEDGQKVWNIKDVDMPKHCQYTLYHDIVKPIVNKLEDYATKAGATLKLDYEP